MLTSRLFFATLQCCLILAKGVPEPTGEYFVSYTEHVFDHITVDDPVAGTGQSLAMTFYYPTLQAPDNTTPYVNNVTAGLFETSFNVTPGVWSALTSPITFQAPPLNASTGKPTIFFAPGAGSNSAIYQILLIDLVSHGYVVAAIDHPYEPPFLQLPYGGPGFYGLPAAYKFGAEFAQYVYRYRVQDLVAAMGFFPGLVEMYGSPFNVTHYGILGGSLGGAAAAEAVKATVGNGNGTIEIIGGINLDGSLWGAPARGGAEADAKLPFFNFAAAGHGAAGDKSWANFTVAQTGYFREIQVTGALHRDFSDRSFWKTLTGNLNGTLGGPIDGLRMTEITRRYVRAFFDKTGGLPPTEGDETLLDEDSADFPEVKISIKKD